MSGVINPPYVPGPDGARRDVKPAVCAACGAPPKLAGVRVPLRGFPGEWLCEDACACTARYRQGTSPESYAAGLRGEILGVTP